MSIRIVKKYFWRILVNIIASSSLLPMQLRYILYRLAGIRTFTRDIGCGARIKFPLLVIGKGTFINDCCVFENLELVEIGENCAVAPEVMFCTTTHDLGGGGRRASRVSGKPIRVGNGCWIGIRAVILPGVIIGDGCVIAAGAVVSGTCDPHGVYAGIPAKRIKDLRE